MNLTQKQQWFEETRAALVTLVNESTLNNIPQREQDIHQYVGMLLALHHLPLVGAPEAPALETAAPLPTLTLAATPTPSDQQRFYFYRKLLGGEGRAEIGNVVFVNEQVVRKLDLQTGDVITAKPRVTYDGRPAYYFELVERGEDIAQDRVEIPFCILSYHVGRWYIHRSLNGDLEEYFEGTLPLQVREDDVERINAQDGDIVNVAFWEEDPSELRLVWRHESRESTQLLEAPKPKVSKPKREGGHTNVYRSEALVGKHVVIFTGQPSHSYREMWDEVGATCEFVTGDESVVSQRAAINRADVVLTVVRVSHKTFYDSIAWCKEYKKPHGITSVGGLRSVLNVTEQAYLRACARQASV